MTTYRLGARSRSELQGVREGIVRVVERAIIITEQDFAVHDGLRLLLEQEEYVRRGVSKTLKSKHITGEAVDLVPYVNGKLRWEWPPIYRVAEAVHQAAEELNVRLVWGAVWDRQLLALDRGNLRGEVDAYVGRCRVKGKRAFLDGPHFETA